MSKTYNLFIGHSWTYSVKIPNKKHGVYEAKYVDVEERLIIG